MNNKGFGVFIGVLAVIILGLVLYFGMRNPAQVVNINATTTPAGNTGGTVNNSQNNSQNNSGNTSGIARAAEVPKVVTDVNVVPSNSTAVVSGHVTPNGAPTTYWYEYGETTALSNRTTTQELGSGFASVSAPGYISGLKANTQYYYRVSAKNRLGTVNGETKTFNTNNNPPAPALAPNAATNPATDITRTTANVSGNVNPRGTETSYWFEYGTDTNFGNVTNFQSAGDGNSSNAVSVSLSGLTPLTKYYYRINAQNAYGTVNGTIRSFTTLGPKVPDAPTAHTSGATTVSTSTVMLNGTVNPNGAETTYWFEYSEDSLLGQIVGNSTGGAINWKWNKCCYCKHYGQQAQE